MGWIADYRSVQRKGVIQLYKSINYTGTAWKGLATPPTDGAFCIFTHPEFGLRALAKLLRNYNCYYSTRTIKSIISRFAPDNENNTAAYIQSVCKATGFEDYKQLDLESEDVLLPLMKAITKHENASNLYRPTNFRGHEMSEKLKKYWNDFRLAIIAGVLTLVYFFGRKRGKENEKASQNKKVLENMAWANKARSFLRNPGITRKLQDKYKR